MTEETPIEPRYCAVAGCGQLPAAHIAWALGHLYKESTEEQPTAAGATVEYDDSSGRSPRPLVRQLPTEAEMTRKLFGPQDGQRIVDGPGCTPLRVRGPAIRYRVHLIFTAAELTRSYSFRTDVWARPPEGYASDIWDECYLTAETMLRATAEEADFTDVTVTHRMSVEVVPDAQEQATRGEAPEQRPEASGEGG